MVLVDRSRTHGENRFLLKTRNIPGCLLCKEIEKTTMEALRSLPMEMAEQSLDNGLAGFHNDRVSSMYVTLHYYDMYKLSHILRTKLKIIYFYLHLIEREFTMFPPK